MVSRVRNDYEQALKLRLSGKSYTEIKNALGIPKSTLSGWFTSIELSDTARKRLKEMAYVKSVTGLIKRNKNQTHLAIQRMQTIRTEAHNEIIRISLYELQLIGVALYWAEGYKKTKVVNGREISSHPVSFVNSDPALISLFLRFLREVCGVKEEKIIASMRIYEHMNEGELLQFWGNITNLSKENFRKTYNGVSKSSLHKRPYNRLQYGTLQITVSDTNLFHKIMGWIEGMAQKEKTH